MMITTFNRKQTKPQVIIHGDHWPVVSAIEHVIKNLYPESRCETTFRIIPLLQRLVRNPDALLLLCLRPREHLFLFYALKNELLCHPALIFTDELLFSDRVVLHCWGDIPAILHQELAGTVDRLRHEKTPYPAKGTLVSFLSAPKPVTGSFAVPLIFNNPKRLMNYMSLQMFRATESCGVTPDQQKLLEEIYRGRHTLSGLKSVLNRDEKKIFQDKNRLLVKLGMKNRLRELMYGTRFCLSQQRTEFIPPDEARELLETESFAAFNEAKS
ncbi:transcriptional regulator [Salmonella enterica]|uniref:transcriptional regulator n=1 Tax=Salmonella sp. 32040203-2019-00173 TaxID=2819779 RepID=UPI00111C8B92|nr:MULTISPECIES: transcriptional regulator [Salmonella]EBU0430666.1 transcriptional regulator [Salmonella enterica]ECM8012572.1 transcriptional regulator [Salmonella enterica subsp. enterica serovar Newport]ECV9049712.1 transcriptional regulator [Salmonella enterica subsp. enterica serovar Newport]EGP3502144.1 transcriptional regulator [Salmonella enterica subsp. enterica serovar Newport]EKY5349805.1 transcriptional regulator [Salmonella enterica]